MKRKVLSMVTLSVFLLSNSYLTAKAENKEYSKKGNNTTNQAQNKEVSIWKRCDDSKSNLKVNLKNGQDVKDVLNKILNEQDEKKGFIFNKDLTEFPNFNLKGVKFKVGDISEDQYGNKHYRTNLLIDDIPVYANQVLIHTDKDGKVYSVNGKVIPKIENIKRGSKRNISKEKAIEVAENSLDFEVNKDNFMCDPKSDLYLYEFNGNVYLVYLVQLQFIDPYLANWQIFVNAEDGSIVDKFNGATTLEKPDQAIGIGVDGTQKKLNVTYRDGQYLLEDRTKPMSGKIMTYDANNVEYYQYLPGTLVSDSDKIFDDDRQKIAVDVHTNIGITYDYYRNILNRNSFDNKGSTIISSVHMGNNYANAAWLGYQMIFGDGDGNQFSPLGSALDVVAHELTHAVTQYSAGLVYRNQSGALNESMSDIIGLAIENKSGDWLMGEDCYTPGTPGDAMRSLKQPTLYNQPDHIKDYIETPYDNGGVHWNSGIPNKVGYSIGSVLGKEAMGKLFYQALTHYLTPTSEFEDARRALLSAAGDIYGLNSSEYNLVMDSWAAVGIGEPSTNQPKDNREPNNNISEASAININTEYESYISKADDVDYYYFDTAKAGDIKVKLSNLSKDYSSFLCDMNNKVLASSQDSGTGEKTLTYKAVEEGRFYVKVVGNGNFSDKPYKLNVNFTENEEPIVKDSFEPNNDIASAYGALEYNKIYESYISKADDVDYYYFDAAKAGDINIQLSKLPKDYSLFLCDANNKVLASSQDSGIVDKALTYTTAREGRFYVKIMGNGNFSDKAYKLNVSFKEKVDTPIGEDTFEPNDYYTEAYGNLENDKEYTSRLSSGSDYDYYYFNMKNNGKVNLEVSNLTGKKPVCFCIYDVNENLVDYKWVNPNSKQVISATVDTGKYYITASGYEEANYSFKVTYPNTEEIKDSFEPNNAIKEAYGALEYNKPYESYISKADDIDYYYFNTAKEGDINVQLSNLSKDYSLYLCDGNDKVLASSQNAGTADKILSYTASQGGRFYAKVLGNGNFSSKPYKLNVNFKEKQDIPTNKDTFEPNNYLNEAYGSLENGKEYISRISAGTDYDYYYFNAENDQEINLQMSNLKGTKPLCFCIYDEGQYCIGYKWVNPNSTETIPASVYTGKYYIRVSGEQQADYSFKLN